MGVRAASLLLAGLFSALLPLSVPAESPRYAPVGGDARQLARELRALIEEAERARAADPRFLKDLRELARRYDAPFVADVLYDDFSDGDFTRNPAWKVIAGTFWVERGYGLRSTVDARSTVGDKALSSEEVAKQLLGTLLQQALKQKGDGGQPAADRAAIHVPGRFANAFELRAELTSWREQGLLQMGPYAGGDPGTGYRLAYWPGVAPGLQLIRTSAAGSAVIASYGQRLKLEDQRVHVVEWSRNDLGEMTVAVDGRPLIQVTDRSFTGPFDGFSLANLGGDFILGRVSIRAAP